MPLFGGYGQVQETSLVSGRSTSPSKKKFYALLITLSIGGFAGYYTYQSRGSGTNDKPEVYTPTKDVSQTELGNNFLQKQDQTDYEQIWHDSLTVQESQFFDAKGRYVLHNYDTSKVFSSFLPGIAGTFGTPMWAFYVNRGQAMASFGVKNKDGPLLEFESASKSYHHITTTGFRTLLKGTRGKEKWNYQPFFEVDEVLASKQPQRDMKVGMNEVEIEEANVGLGLRTTVEYFTLANQDFPALVRRLTLTNTLDSPLSLEVLDGLARMEPFGVDDWGLKNIGRTLEAWAKVYNMDDDPTMPFYHNTASAQDTEVVTAVVQGNFALGFLQVNSNNTGEEEEEVGQALPYVADPVAVFGMDPTLRVPNTFFTTGLQAVLQGKQMAAMRTPCALAGASVDLGPGGSAVLTQVYGRAPTLQYLQDHIKPLVAGAGFMQQARVEARSLVQDMTAPVQVQTASPLFNAYVQYNFLDNLLRGGYPLLLGDADKPKVFHTFSRIHGDLERDYNAFTVDPTYFSQGPGNFRDVNQNRRSDVMWQPGITDYNIRTFYTFTQADGYNPLTIMSPVFVLSAGDALTLAQRCAASADKVAAMATVLSNPGGSMPGDIFVSLSASGVELKEECQKQKLVDLVASTATQQLKATHGLGFWSDHWTYNQDLIDSYLKVYPDQAEALLWGTLVDTWNSPAFVLPRDGKYVLLHGKPRQVGATAYKGTDAFSGYAPDSPCITYMCDNSTGQLYKMPLITKVLMLAVNKFASMDPLGMGVEMEGGKPGWLDALNGLPAMFGSGMPETYELLRTLYFLHGTVKMHSWNVVEVPNELRDFIQALTNLVDQYNVGTIDNFQYWDQTSAAKEKYRQSIFVAFSGGRTYLECGGLTSQLSLFIAKVEGGIQRALTMFGGASLGSSASAMEQGAMTPTYFSWEMTKYEHTGSKDGTGRPFLKAQAFEPTVLPLYLEGPVRLMKVLPTKTAKQALYNKVKASGLHDEKLQMFKISENLAGQSVDTGRITAFAGGWLENESIWLHMSYKFYLEMVRAGLYAEFWEQEAKHGLVAFMDPTVYGRSPLEASSFLASSALPDETLHGTGFVSRLSGSTAEFLSLFLEVFVGHGGPFRLKPTDGKTLQFVLQPALPAWMFTPTTDLGGSEFDAILTFTLLGKIPVTYHNPNLVNTWSDGVMVRKMTYHLQEANTMKEFTVEIMSSVAEGYNAQLVRSGLVKKIDVYLA